jgi:hypothetical protein
MSGAADCDHGCRGSEGRADDHQSYRVVASDSATLAGFAAQAIGSGQVAVTFHEHSSDEQDRVVGRGVCLTPSGTAPFYWGPVMK